MSITIEIEWAEILRPTTLAPFSVHKCMEPHVGCFRLFPGISADSLQAFLNSPIRGVVLETFGTGNAPDNRPELIMIIREALDRGVVIVNITQCQHGSVSEIYSTGHALAEVGVISGRDMTAECALVKLSFLLGRAELTVEEVRRLMSESLKGELSSPIVLKPKTSNSPTSWLVSAFNTAVLATTISHRDAVDELLRPLLIQYAASQGDVDAIKHLAHYENALNCLDFDLRTPLHISVSCGQLDVVDWLLRHGADVHLRDRLGKTPVMPWPNEHS